MLVASQFSQWFFFLSSNKHTNSIRYDCVSPFDLSSVFLILYLSAMAICKSSVELTTFELSHAECCAGFKTHCKMKQPPFSQRSYKFSFSFSLFVLYFNFKCTMYQYVFGVISLIAALLLVT